MTANEDALIFIFEIGTVIIFSLIVAKVLSKRGIPQVLGLIFGGFFLQFLTFLTSSISIVTFPTPPDPLLHYIITTAALGFIGYSIGAHLDLWKLRDASWGLVLILLGNTIGTFILVTLVISVILQDLIIGIILGTIAMATAPASTAEVIREYQSRGSLSQTILFLIAFDDILTIIFFSVAISFAVSAYSGVDLSLIEIFLPIIVEIGGSIILGIILALIMRPFHIEGVEAYQSAEFVFPSVLICIALAGLLHFSVILSCIVFGLTLSTMARCENKECVRGVERLAVPIIALFFILVGYEMDLGLLVTPIIIIILIFFIMRVIGKTAGSYIPAYLAKMPTKVTNNIPLALLSQAGVALGLAALAYTRFVAINMTETAVLILDIVAVNVLIAEIIGPLLLKKALVRSGEITIEKN
ncbi:MAG: cation:proton antiporter [Candidatus Hodarchaeales archaeon]|jgi:Kef-type K+ transport system membrane component KefB